VTLLTVLKTLYALPTDHTLWANTVTPGVPDAGDTNAVEVGTKFTVDTVGWVTGIWFYKSTANTGTHVGHLWTSLGVPLASVTFTGETTTGWQVAPIDPPVAVATGTVYVVSYHAPQGHYAAASGYFAAGYDAPPLHAPAGSNGVYLYTATPAFPTETYGDTNYWVTPVFNYTLPPGQSAVGQTTGLQWPVRAARGSTSDARWPVRALATATEDTQWAVSALAGRTLNALWAARAMAGAQRDYRWPVKALAGQATDIRWQAKGVAGADADIRWQDNDKAAADTDARWQVRALADPTLDVRWQTVWVASGDVDARWQTRVTAAQAVDLQWRTLISAGVFDLDVRWQVDRTSLTIWPDTNGWTAVRDSRRTVSALSTDYVRADVVPPPRIDPRTAGVEVAIVLVGSVPGPADWLPGTWWHDDVDPLAWKTWTAMALVGPNASLALSPGTYGLWLRIDSSTVVPPVRDVTTVIQVSTVTVE
jgi:hypothetical protein